MTIPVPTPIYRIIHVDNLKGILQRDGIFAPNFIPQDGIPYRTIHNEQVQEKRHVKQIYCGPGGVVHDYVGFYFGYLSVMMLNLKTGRVEGYNEGQEPLIYLISSCQAVAKGGGKFVFTDGHGIAAWTAYYDDLGHLDQVDWDMVYQRYWHDTDDDLDRQRRKQAEFLVHKSVPWSLVDSIAVIDKRMQGRVEAILAEFPEEKRRMVRIEQTWYYY